MTLKICRVCLITNVKMCDLGQNPLEMYFEQTIGINHISAVELPLMVCYECAALIKKFHFFKEKCLRGQAVLYELLNTGQVKNNINKIDRKSLNLVSSLSSFTINQNSIIDISSIKEEHDMIIPSLLDNDLVKVEPNVKLSYSSDDEPLSFHAKEKVEKNNKRKLSVSSNEDIGDDDYEPDPILDIDFELNDNEIEVEFTPKKKQVKPKKSKKKKVATVAKVRERRTKNTGGVSEDEIDLEQLVSVVELTLEEQKKEILARKDSSNYRNAEYQCDLCYKGFIDTTAWKHHLNKHSFETGDHVCPVCKFHFKTKRSLQKHVSIHEKKYVCKSCKQVSKTPTQAKQHQMWHKGVTYKCQYCDDVSTKWTSYLSHVRIKHPSEYICGSCGYSFVSQLGLTMHKTMMHKNEKINEDEISKAPYCAQCEVQFTNEEAWKRHMVTSGKHINDNECNFGCKDCGTMFGSAESLRLHHRQEHARKRPKNYGRKSKDLTYPMNCEHCDEEIQTARDYWVHFRRVHPDQNYPILKSHICDVCGKSFRSNAFLVYHMRTHTEVRAFKCSQCPKAFFNRTNLQMHKKTHSENRPYPCSVCLKAFKCKGALDRHFRSHTGEKPFQCEVCGKSFGQSNSRKLHVRTVHLKQPAPYISKSRLERRKALMSKVDIPIY